MTNNAAISRISPTYVGEDRIIVTLNSSSLSPLARQPVTLDIDYDNADPEGIILPIEIIVQPAFGSGGEGGGYIRKIFRRSAPTSFSFTPIGAGKYLIIVREIAHNFWQGRIVITVSGDDFFDVQTERSS